METESEQEQIINRVASSPLITFNLEEFHQEGARVVFDLKDYLFQGIILKEKEFREQLQKIDWSQYQDKFVSIVCSSDAIIPTWSFMLVSLALQPFAKGVFFGSPEQFEVSLYLDQLSKVNWEQYRDAKVVIKGCSKVEVPVAAYVEVCARLRPLAASVMFGEPCSTVPLYKRPKSRQ